MQSASRKGRVFSRATAVLLGFVLIFGSFQVTFAADEGLGVVWEMRTSSGVQGRAIGEVGNPSQAPLMDAGSTLTVVAAPDADVRALQISNRDADWNGLDVLVSVLRELGMTPGANAYRIAVTGRRPADSGTGNAVMQLRGTGAPWDDLATSAPVPEAGGDFTMTWDIDFELLAGRNIRIQSAHTSTDIIVDNIVIERTAILGAGFTLEADGVVGSETTEEITINFAKALSTDLAASNISLDGGGSGASIAELNKVSDTEYVLQVTGINRYGRAVITIDHPEVLPDAVTVLLHWEGGAMVLTPGPRVFADSTSPTGYSVQFVLHRPGASFINLSGAFGLRSYDGSGATGISPHDYVQGLVPSGDYTTPMHYYGNGYWSVTLPLPGGTYSYWFTGDGIPSRIYDPANPPHQPDGHNLMIHHSDMRHSAVAVPWSSQQHPRNNRDLELPRENAAERGRVVSSRFESGIAAGAGLEGSGNDANPGPGMSGYQGDMFGYVLVYLPPNHDPNRAEAYPVVYMSHGWWNDSTSWMNGGAIPQIMDNLIALGYIQPTIVVSVNNTRHGLVYTRGSRGANALDDVINYIMPHIESTFNASTDPQYRAIGGYSLGTEWAGQMYVQHPEHFRHYGLFCLMAPSDEDLQAVPDEYKYTSVIVAGRGTFSGHQAAIAAILENVPNSAAYEGFGGHERHAWAQLFTIWARDYLWVQPDGTAPAPTQPVHTHDDAEDCCFVFVSPSRRWDITMTDDTGAPLVYLRDDRSFTQARAFVNNFLSDSADIDWNPSTETVTIQGEHVVTGAWTTVVLTVGSTDATVNGTVTDIEVFAGTPAREGMTVAFTLPPGRTMLPIRFLGNAFGVDIDWISAESAVQFN